MNHEGFRTAGGPYNYGGSNNFKLPPASSVYSSTYDDIPLQNYLNSNLTRTQSHQTTTTQATQDTARSTLGFLPPPVVVQPKPGNSVDGHMGHPQRARTSHLYWEKVKENWTRAWDFTKKHSHRPFGQTGSPRGRRLCWKIFIFTTIAGLIAGLVCGIYLPVKAHIRARAAPANRLEKVLSNRLPENILVLDPPSYDQHLDVFGQEKTRASPAFIAIMTAKYPLYFIPSNHTIRRDPAILDTHPILSSSEFVRCGKLGRVSGGDEVISKGTLYKQNREIEEVAFRESVGSEAYVLYFGDQIRSCWLMTEEMLRIQKEWSRGTRLEWLDLYFSLRGGAGREKQKAVGDGDGGHQGAAPNAGSPQVILP